MLLVRCKRLAWQLPLSLQVPSHFLEKSMSLAFLRQLAAQPLPLNISDRDGIENVQRLRAAGLIAALVLRPPPSRRDEGPKHRPGARHHR